MGRTVFARRAALVVAAVMSFLTSAPASAQQQAISMPQAVEYSLNHNGELNSFRAEKGIRDAARTKAGLLSNPTVELEAGSGALTGSSDESTLSVGLFQEFLLSGKRDKRLHVAEKELEIYRWQLADRERVLRAEVKEAFYDALLAQQLLALADRAVEVNRQLYEVTKERLAAGDIPELEKDLAKVELARSEGARISAVNILNQSQTRLWEVMGLPREESAAVAGAPDVGVPMGKSLAEMQGTAAAMRPDLRALEAEQGRGDAEIALAHAQGVPDITAGLVVKRDTTSIEVGGVEGKDTAYIVGVKLSIPIPVFDKNQAGLQEASARRSSTDSRVLAARRGVAREVDTAYTMYLNSERVLSLYRTNIVPQLEENLKLTQEAYRIGEVGILAVIQEQKKFFEVNEGYLAAQHDRQAALVKLEAAVATELPGGAQ